MEHQAVLLAGSQGTALYPLCEETPPSLLTVATRPLLHYQLDYLERNGFTECIIVTRTIYLRQLAHSLEHWKSEARRPRHHHTPQAATRTTPT